MGQVNKYFFVNSNHILHKGINGFALYDLVGGDIFTINHKLGTILEITEKGSTVEETAERTQLDLKDILEELDNLVQQKRGNFYNSRVYIEKYKFSQVYVRPPISTTGIQRCFIELPGSCRSKCSFCETPSLFQCNKCTKISTKPNLTLIKDFLHRIIQMNCRSLVFHGGDPLSELHQLTLITDWCRKHSYEGEICVVTNGTQLNNDIWEVFSRNKITPIIPLFSINPLITEKKLYEICSIAQQKNIATIFTMVMVESNPDSSTYKKFITRLNPQNVWPAVVYDNDRNTSPIYPTLYNAVVRVDANRYYHNKWLHPCLWGTIALTADGNVLPCPHLKTEILGSMKDANCIYNIFENEDLIFKYWERLCLSNISKCKDCSFNHGCLDCRALEKRITGDLYGKYVCSLKR
jgi:radical SAM protein with 4Fe4S-binding SPASM domain